MKLNFLLLLLMSMLSISTYASDSQTNNIVPSTQINIVDVLAAKPQTNGKLGATSDTLISLTNNTGGNLTLYGLFVAAAYTDTACSVPTNGIRNTANAAYSEYPPFTINNNVTTQIGGSAIYSSIYADLSNSGDAITTFTSGVESVKSIRFAEITSQISAGNTGQTARCSTTTCKVPTVTNGTTVRLTSHTGAVCVPVTCSNAGPTPTAGTCNTGTTAGSNVAIFL